GTFIGSPGYMSVEQIKGKGVDYRSDIYSLSILFYELVTGVLPYKGSSSHDTVLKIMNGKYKLPKQHANYLPNEIQNFIVKGMQREPSKRFQSLEELNLEIDALLFKNGFVESHVELERYFLNKVAYEDRLKSKICAEYFDLFRKSSEVKSDQSATLPAMDVIKKIPDPIRDSEKTMLLQSSNEDSATFLQVPLKHKMPNYLLKNPKFTQLAGAAKSSTPETTPTIFSQEETKKIKELPKNLPRNPETYPRRQLARYKLANRVGHKKNNLLNLKLLSLIILLSFALYLIFSTLFFEKSNSILPHNLVNVFKKDVTEFLQNSKSSLKIDTRLPNNSESNSIEEPSLTDSDFSSVDHETKSNTVVAADIKHQVTIRTNMRPIKVAFVDLENGRDFEYIQSSYQEIYSLSPGRYELKTFHGIKIKKSKPFILDEQKVEERIFTTEF
ncbi:MAG: protein kinase, partial [Oligoflexales bacterium]|nr:protein kinase [Oligoflexales bacterium]